MTDRGGGRRPAVLGTSFWTVAYRAEVMANCLDLYDLIVPRAVEAEIRGRQPGSARREYPYAMLFRHLRPQMSDPPEGDYPPIARFGRGEAEAIALARSLRVPLLINERPAATYASRAGVRIVTVPAVIVLLRRRDVISDRAARRKLDLIEPNTTPSTIASARRALEQLSAAST